MPLAAVSEHTDVASAHHLGATAHIASELPNRIGTYVAHPQVPLHFEDRGANLNIDSPLSAGLLLQHDVIELVVVQVQRGGVQKQMKVSLDIGFRSFSASVSETPDNSHQINPNGVHPRIVEPMT